MYLISCHGWEGPRYCHKLWHELTDDDRRFLDSIGKDEMFLHLFTDWYSVQPDLYVGKKVISSYYKPLHTCIIVFKPDLSEFKTIEEADWWSSRFAEKLEYWRDTCDNRFDKYVRLEKTFGLVAHKDVMAKEFLRRATSEKYRSIFEWIFNYKESVSNE